MSKIRINDLARELEIKSKAIVDYLPSIGITDKRSHSSALDDEQADQVRAHFRALAEHPETPEPERKKAAPPALEVTPAPAKPSPKSHTISHLHEHAETTKAHEVRPMTRSIAEIKAEARRAVMGPTTPKVVAPPVAPPKPAAAAGPVAPPTTPPPAVKRPGSTPL